MELTYVNELVVVPVAVQLLTYLVVAEGPVQFVVLEYAFLVG
jgi:hypothetical protein